MVAQVHPWGVFYCHNQRSSQRPSVHFEEVAEEVPSNLPFTGHSSDIIARALALLHLRKQTRVPFGALLTVLNGQKKHVWPEKKIQQKWGICGPARQLVVVERVPALINPLRTAAARRVPSDNSAVSVGPVPVGFQIAPARITLADVSVVRPAGT